MKYLFAFVILTLFDSIIAAQNWAPIGAKWIFGVGEAFSGDISTKKWIATGDTLIGVYNCRVIQGIGYPVTGDISDKIITYEADNIIYWFNNNQFTVLYDFNKEAGESWITRVDDCDLEVHVESTGTQTINGFHFKTMVVSSEDYAFDGKIIEHIGHMERPTPDVILHCKGIFVDADYYRGLCCYSDEDFGFYDFGIEDICDNLFVGLDPVNDELKFTLFPNPANQEIRINTNSVIDYKYTIYNSLGQEVLHGSQQGMSTAIDISDQPPGIYIVALMANHASQRQSFIIQK